MSDLLLQALVLGALAIAAAAALSLPFGRAPGRGLLAAAGLLELALIAQAVGALIAVAGDAGAREPGVFLGYLVISVALLPGAYLLTRGGSRWDSVILMVSCIALAVVLLRLEVAWGG